MGAVAATVAVDGVDEGHTMNRTKLSFPRVSRALSYAFLAGVAACALPAWAQQAFPTPESVAEALVDGVARNDDQKVDAVLGADWKKYIPVEYEQSEDTLNFLAAWATGHRIVAAGNDKAWLEVGTKGWTLPIPIVKSQAGWSFDTKAAPEEMRIRRIGRNELAVIKVALAYVDAQEDYARYLKKRGGKASYAQKILSTPGKRDGLYWETKPGEQESPIGPLLADRKAGEPYHGYRYRILLGQGKNAPGGTKPYLRDGQMVDGFALVAWPAKWGDTGVMTFIVNQDGVVYEKDLGPRTEVLARAMQAFDPNASWRKATPQ